MKNAMMVTRILEEVLPKDEPSIDEDTNQSETISDTGEG